MSGRPRPVYSLTPAKRQKFLAPAAEDLGKRQSRDG